MPELPNARQSLRLLQPMSIGASVTNGGRLSPGQWKAVFRAWPKAKSSPGSP